MARKKQAPLLQADPTKFARQSHLEKRLRNRAAQGDAAEVKRLIGAGAEVNSSNEEGMTALHVAAAAGSLSCLRILKEFGADVHAKTLAGQTAYELAAIHGHNHLVSLPGLWAEHRPDLTRPVTAFGIGLHPRPGRVHWTDVNQKRLRTCAQFGDLEGVEFLLKAGCDPTAEDEHGRDAMALAEEKGYDSIVKVLMDAPIPRPPTPGRGAADATGQTPGGLVAGLDDDDFFFTSPATGMRPGEAASGGPDRPYGEGDDDNSTKIMHARSAKDGAEGEPTGEGGEGGEGGDKAAGEAVADESALLIPRSLTLLEPRFAFGQQAALSKEVVTRALSPIEVKWAKAFLKHAGTEGEVSNDLVEQ